MPFPAWAVVTFLLSLGLWMGAAVFLTAGVLPALFMNLEPSQAGNVATLVFPIYFRGGLVLALVACLASFVLVRGRGRAWQAAFAVLVAITLGQAWQALVLHPEMARIRGVESQVVRFQQLHKLSVRINTVVLAGGLALFGASALLVSRRDAKA